MRDSLALEVDWRLGSEFCSQLVDLWAYQHKMQIDFFQPRKPTDNA